MPVAFVQEFAITDRSTANYDSVKESLGDDPIDGLIIHTAGFDDDNKRVPDLRPMGVSGAG